MSNLKEVDNNLESMPDRFTGYLDAYDLFGKAIPGVAWFFGLVSVAPTKLEVGLPDGAVRLRSLAVLVVVSALVGVIFGQGVDILARLFEQLLAWIRRQVRRLARLVLIILGKISVGVRSSLGLKLEDAIESYPQPFSIFTTGAALFGITAAVLAILIHGPPLWIFVIDFLISFIIPTIICIDGGRTERDDNGGGLSGVLEQFEVLEDFEHPDPSAVFANTYRWVLGRLNAINTAVISHRSLFAAYLDSRADAYVEPTDPDDIAYGRFEDAVEPFLDVNLEDFGQQENQISFTDLYPFITSYLRANGFNRAKGFQARYSFCRSMWLTTSIFATVLLGLHVKVFGLPELEGLSRTEPIPIVSFVFVILWFLLLAVFIGRLFESATRSMNKYSPTVVWVIGLGYAVLVLSSDPLRKWLVIQTHKVLWDVFAGLITTIAAVSETGASLSSFLFQYENFNQVVAVQIFEESLIGLAVLLLVSAVAFFDATRAYKRNYVEYLVAEASISLPYGVGGSVDDETSLSEPNRDRDSSNGDDNDSSNGDDNGSDSGGASPSGGGTSESDQKISEVMDADNPLPMPGQQSGTTSSSEPPEESKQEENPNGD